MRWHRYMWEQGRHHLFKGGAFTVTAICFVLVFILKPKLLNDGLDLNLGLVKHVGSLIETFAPDWGDRFETFSRFINFERILLFSEAVAAVKLIMLGIGGTFRLVRRICNKHVGRTRT
ncbi:MAG TPA: hypothetical protein VMH91_03330 [Candidatus Paceibacterota bacterium]|nr:hypothetical protein [Candidatus Paceibacterota bacterium]